MSSAAVTKKENAPANSMRPTREDGTKADEQRYQSELDRIKQNERKFSKIKLILSQFTRDITTIPRLIVRSNKQKPT